MAITVGSFWPPQQAVSIVNKRTGQQIQFDYPSDMVEYLRRHPELKMEDFLWTTAEISGGH